MFLTLKRLSWSHQEIGLGIAFRWEGGGHCSPPCVDRTEDGLNIFNLNTCFSFMRSPKQHEVFFAGGRVVCFLFVFLRENTTDVLGSLLLEITILYITQ